VPIQHLIGTWILAVHAVQQTTRNLDQSWHWAAISRSQRDAAHNKEADITQIDCAPSLVAKPEGATGYNNWTLKSQRMLGPKRDGKINGEGIDALVHLLRNLRSTALARRGHLCALSWRHLRTACRLGTHGIDRWSFATETHLAISYRNGAPAASTNAAADLVRQE
jgi:hypothetical protein